MRIFYKCLLVMTCSTVLLSCGKIDISVGDQLKNISGIVKPLQGRIASSSNTSLELISEAQAAVCSDPVYAKIYEIDALGNQADDPLATQLIQADARFLFDPVALGISLSTGVSYVVEVAGCNNFLSRPITDLSSGQDIDYNTTIVSFATTVDFTKNLNEVDRVELDSFLKKVPGNSLQVVRQNIRNDPDLSSKYQKLFGVSTSTLDNAAPKIYLYTVPTMVSEKISTTFQIGTVHPSPTYNTVYKWKLNGVTVSSASTFNFTAGGNDQGIKMLTIYSGKDDGSGEIDTTKPYIFKNTSVLILNNELPVAPNISVASNSVSNPNITVDINTGFAMVNCDTFTSLALTENMTSAPTNPAMYSINCTQAVSQGIPFILSPALGVKTLRLWAMDAAGKISVAPQTLTMTLTGASTPSVAHSTVSVSAPSIASGNSVTVTLVAKDVTSTQLIAGGLTVAFSRTGGTSTGTFSAVIDNGDGTYSSTFTGVLAGTATTINATIGGSAVTTLMPTVSVTPGLVSLSQSLITSSATSVNSGGSVTLTLQAKDASGNNLTSGGQTVAFSNAGGTSTGTISATTDVGNGTYAAIFTGLSSGTATTIGATLGGSAITSAPLPTVTVNTGTISVAQSMISVSSATLASGGAITLTLTARDASANAITSGGRTVVFTHSGGTSTGTISGTTDVGNGTYTATFTGNLSGTATTINATIDTVAVTSTLPTATVGAGAASLANSIVSVSSSSIASGGSSTVTLTARDAANNAITSSGLTVLFSRSGGVSTGTFSGVTDVGNGTYTATFTGVLAGSATTINATIGGSAVTSTLPTIAVSPGSLNLANSEVSVSSATVASGSNITLTLTAKDSAGNQLTTGGLAVVFTHSGGTSTGTISGSTTDNANGTYSRTFTGVVAGTATTINATIGGSAVTSTMPTVTVGAGAADLSQSLITSSASTVNSGGSVTLTLQAKDASGNNLTSGGQTVVFNNAGGTSTGTISATTDVGNGTYTATLSGLVAGTATTIGATVGGSAITTTPFPTVTVSPGAFSLLNSLIVASDTTVVSGSTLDVVFTPMDAAGNLFPTGITTVTMGASAVGGTGTFSAVTPVIDGTYTATFTGVLAGSVSLHANINGSQITSTLPVVTVTAPSIPILTLTSTPDVISNQTSATFVFSIDMPGSTAECQLDAAAASPCTSPLTLTLLSQGAHTLTITPTNASTSGTSVSFNWTIDSIGPSPAVAGLHSSNPTNVSLVNLTMTSCTDVQAVFVNTTGIAPGALDSGWQTCSTAAGAINTTILVEGTHLLNVWSKDAVGNVSVTSSDVSLTYNITAPVVNLTSLDGGEAFQNGTVRTITWTASDDLAMATSPISLHYSEDAGANWVVIATGEINDGSYSWTTPTINGVSFRVRVTALDSQGNSASDASSSSFTMDSQAPVFASGQMIIQQGAAATTKRINVSLQASDAYSFITHYCLKYVNSPPTSSSACWRTVGSPALTLSLSNVSYEIGEDNASYTVYGWVRDSLGNISSLTAAGAGTAATDRASTTLTFSCPYTLPASVSVAHTYAGSPNWNDFVVKNQASNKLWNQTGTACAGAGIAAETPITGCFHAGMLKKVEVTGVNSCYGLTISDAESTYAWECDDSTGTATFYSLGFKPGKGLRNLVNGTSWKSNEVTVSCGVQTSLSTATTWYTNPVAALPNNSLSTDDPIRLDGTDDDGAGPDQVFAAGTVFTLASSQASRGYNIPLHRASIVTLPGAVMSFIVPDVNTDNVPDNFNVDFGSAAIILPHPCATCTKNALIAFPQARFSWVEGEFRDSNGNAGLAAERIITYRSAHWPRIHNADIRSIGALTENVFFTQPGTTIVTDVKLSCFTTGVGTTGISVGAASYPSLLTNVKVANCGTGIYDWGPRTILQNVVVSGAGTAIYDRGGFDHVYTLFTTNSSSTGIAGAPARTTLHLGTLANSSLAGIQWGTTDLLANQVGFINNLYGIRLINGNNNVFQNIYLSSSTYDIIIQTTSANNQFLDNIHTSTNCLNTTTTLPNTNNIPTNLSPGASCSKTDTSPNFLSALSPVSSFNAMITSTDALNTSTVSGTGTKAYTSITDWINFEHQWRSFGKTSGSAPYLAAQQGRCLTATTCHVWDFKPLPGDTVFKNQGPDGSANGSWEMNENCPAEIHGNQTLTDFITTPNTFLKRAFEIIHDGVGDEDGLCESNERCIYAPNFATSYQGEGDFTRHSCVFNNGTVTDVTMYMFPNN